MAQWTAINVKRVHPTSKAPLCNFKKTDKGRAGILGTPPSQTPEQDGGMGTVIGPMQDKDGGTTYNPGKPRKTTLQNSLSSQAGWEFYQAVRKAAQGGRARPADRLPATAEEQAGVTPQVEVQEEVEWSRQVAAAGPANLEDHEGSQRDFQADWEMGQEWLQECAEPSDEIGPWADLVG